MSKKNRNKFQAQTSSGIASSFAAHSGEYRIIRNDLIRFAILNVLFLAAVLAVYFTNRSSGYLERIFNQIVK